VKGSDLAAFVINPTDRGLRYGVFGTSDRWSGGVWEPSGAWTTSLDGWGGFGSFGGPPGPVRTIGLTAEARGIGLGEYFSVPPLQPGWYRIGHGEAYGMFEVTETAPMTSPLRGQSKTGPLVTMRPTLFGPSAGTARLSGILRSPSVTTSEDYDQFNRDFDPEVMVEHWEDGDWTSLTTIAVQIVPRPIDGVPEAQVAVPGLALGTYRLVWHHAEEGDLTRVFWVIDSLPDVPNRSPR